MEFRPYYLAREWVSLGHEVTVVASSFSHLRYLGIETSKPLKVDWIDGIQYIWLKTPHYQGNNVRRLVNIFVFITQLFIFSKRILAKSNPEIIVASSTYPLDMVPAHYLARKSGSRLVFELHDLWPLSLIELGGMSPRHPFVLLMQWAENFTYRKTDKVISVLPKSRDHMVQHGLEPGKFMHIPNGIVISEWGAQNNPLPGQHQALFKKLEGKGEFIFGYAGSHSVGDTLDNLIFAADILKNDSVAVAFVGDGPNKINLQKQAERLGIRNVYFLPPVPKGSIPELLAQMDSLYIGWQRKPIYRFGISPNKLFDYMMASKPVIHAHEERDNIVTEAGCGLTIAPEDPEALAQAIRQLMAMSREERAAMGQRGRDYVLANHDYCLLARKFIEAVQ
jgi:glycosyltransferase involved in cell wall biosynthesis